MIGRIAAALLLSATPACAMASEESAQVQSDVELDDDPDHPIPYIFDVDVMAEGRDGSEVLLIIIASPLEADERSQRRLLAKIEGYLSFINSEEFRRDFGSPSREKTLIQVMIHPDSDPAIFDLLERSRPWVEEGGASLEISSEALVAE